MNFSIRYASWWPTLRTLKDIERSLSFFMTFVCGTFNVQAAQQFWLTIFTRDTLVRCDWKIQTRITWVFGRQRHLLNCGLIYLVKEFPCLSMYRFHDWLFDIKEYNILLHVKLGMEEQCPTWKGGKTKL